VSGRRVLAVVAAIVLVVLAAVLAVFAVDVLRWRGQIEEADFRYEARAGERDMWTPDTLLPLRLSRAVLDVDDDLALRDTVQRFGLARLRQLPRDQRDLARRGQVETELAELGERDLGAERRSLVANLRGALSFEEARFDEGQRATFLRRSLAEFREAIKQSPENEDAKYNLELVLRLIQTTQNESAAGGGGTRGETPASGAGQATAGSGY
jgi:hypothetical protein